ncbi:MAG: divalent-cation tolerance protein CutA [Aquificae bacterium]|nr:divalent-cation tolerance protein CutA [Aquificota bacterium]
MEYIVVYVTTPNYDTAKNIAESLINSKLAACVNIVESIFSVYFWQGNIERDNESLMIIKTKANLFEKLEEKVKSLHPYSVPEIIAMPIVKGSTDYLKWIDDTVNEE